MNGLIGYLNLNDDEVNCLALKTIYYLAQKRKNRECLLERKGVREAVVCWISHFCHLLLVQALAIKESQSDRCDKEDDCCSGGEERASDSYQSQDAALHIYRMPDYSPLTDIVQ